MYSTLSITKHNFIQHNHFLIKVSIFYQTYYFQQNVFQRIHFRKCIIVRMHFQSKNPNATLLKEKIINILHLISGIWGSRLEPQAKARSSKTLRVMKDQLLFHTGYALPKYRYIPRPFDTRKCHYTLHYSNKSFLNFSNIQQLGKICIIDCSLLRKS